MRAAGYIRKSELRARFAQARPPRHPARAHIEAASGVAALEEQRVQLERDIARLRMEAAGLSQHLAEARLDLSEVRGEVDRYDQVKELQAKAGPYPTSGNPLIIGEHEVRPVCCEGCGRAVPWDLIKGWRR